jgi:hypothetical protein
MKPIITLFVVLLSFSALAQAPDRMRNQKRIKALKIAFITDRLDLSEKEAEKFWPIYNKFNEAESKLKFIDLRQLKSKARNSFDSLTDAEASKMLEEIMAIEDELHKMRIQYMSELKTILPAKKIMLLKAVEDEFNRKMFEEFKKRRERRQPE